MANANNDVNLQSFLTARNTSSWIRLIFWDKYFSVKYSLTLFTFHWKRRIRSRCIFWFDFLPKWKRCFSHFTNVCAFFLHKTAVSRPTRSITSRIRSCLSSIRGWILAFFDEENFLFKLLDNSANKMSLIVSPTWRKSSVLAI